MKALVRDRREIQVLLAIAVIAGLGNGLFLPWTFVYLVEVRHLSSALTGLVAGWVGLAGLIAAGPVGALADRVGARRAAVGASVLCAAGFAAYAGVHDAWQAFGAATLVGFAGAPLIGVWNTVLARAARPDEQQKVFGIAFAALNLGTAVGGLVGGFVADVHRPASFELLYIAAAAAFVVVAGLLATLRMTHDAGASTPRLEDASAPHGVGYAAVLGDERFRRFLVMNTLLLACAYAQLNFGFAAFAVHVGHVSTRVVGWAFAANTVVIVVAQLPVTRYVEGRARTRMIAGAALLISLSWALLAAGAAARHTAPELAAAGVVSCAVVFGLGEVLMTPVLPALTNSLASEANRARYNSVSSMAFSANEVIGPATAGTLIGGGLAGAWAAAIVTGPLIAALLALSLGRRLTADENGMSPRAPVSVSAARPS